MNQEFQLFPESASTVSGQVDRLFLFLCGMSAVLTLLVAALVITFAVRYRSGAAVDRSGKFTGIKLEITWIVLSVPVLMGIFYWGARVAFAIFDIPENAAPVTVVGKQWMWKFQHAGGRREINTLHVPTGRPVRLTMISQDVIHSFFVPAFRVKQDVVPARYVDTWFEATKPGNYRLYCAEYCGTDHSKMIGTIVAMTPSDFSQWLARGSADVEPPAVAGGKLFQQMRCNSCHQGGGVQSRGPALEGIYLRPVALRSGQSVIADDDYLRESILRPAEKVVAGYQPIMPPYEAQLDEESVLLLIAYIKSLGSGGAPAGDDPGAGPPAAGASAAPQSPADPPAPEGGRR